MCSLTCKNNCQIGAVASYLAHVALGYIMLLNFADLIFSTISTQQYSASE